MSGYRKTKDVCYADDGIHYSASDWEHYDKLVEEHFKLSGVWNMFATATNKPMACGLPQDKVDLCDAIQTLTRQNRVLQSNCWKHRLI